MLRTKVALMALSIVSFSLAEAMAADGPSDSTAKDFEEFQKALTDVKAALQSFPKQPDHSLARYEEFADGVVRQWKQRNKEHFGWLMLELTGPPMWDIFSKDSRRYEVARKYALLALENADAMPVGEELKLTFPVPPMQFAQINRIVPKGEQFAECRRKDTEVLLHAWKRLLDTVDPNFKPSDPPGTLNSVAGEMGMPPGAPPEAVKEPLRWQYEAALEANRQKIAHFSEQWRLRGWIERSKFPEKAERDIARLYCEPPLAVDELKRRLEHYLADEKTRARIVDTITKNYGTDNLKFYREPNP